VGNSFCNFVHLHYAINTKYFIVKDGYIYNDFDGSYLGYLEQNYQKLLFDDGYVMYVLDGTAKAGAQ
jgi:hypothetical protein